MVKSNEDYMSIDEILSANGVNQRMLVENLIKEGKIPNRETVEDIKSDIELNREKTDKNKKKFINSIKGELGKEILKNPGGVEVIKKPWYVKIGDLLKKLFTRF